MPLAPWFLLAIAASLCGYATYGIGLRRRLVEPNRASWLIWSAATTVEAATYAAVNAGALQSWVFLLSAVACIAVTLGIWRRAAWEAPSRTEAFCMAVCLLALALWALDRSAFWAHMLVVAAVPVSFWPTWQSVWADPRRERSPAWGLWTVGDLATLLVATHVPGGIAGEYSYILVELACHASVWFLIGLPSINPLRSLGWRDGRLVALDAGLPATTFRVGDNHLGKAVYAVEGIARGAVIVEFTGKLVHVDAVPGAMRGRADRFLQVAPDLFMGPSGGIDDLINHSCAPNAGLRFTATGLFLIAARDIAAGEEIAWDYSTTLAGSDWHMICQCRAPDCRRVIGNFETLPPERQEWFRSHNLVAPYLRRKDRLRHEQAA